VIEDKNYALANYQLDKIKKAIENGIERRAARKANSRAMFLDTQYKSMKEVLEKEDDKVIKKHMSRLNKYVIPVMLQREFLL